MLFRFNRQRATRYVIHKAMRRHNQRLKLMET